MRLGLGGGTVDKREETIGRDGWMTTAGSARGFRH